MLVESQLDMEVVGEAKTCREAIDEVRKLKPDIVVMDVSMPEFNGIEYRRTHRKAGVYPGILSIAPVPEGTCSKALRTMAC